MPSKQWPKPKAAQHRALTGEKADYPSLSQVWSWDVGACWEWWMCQRDGRPSWLNVYRRQAGRLRWRSPIWCHSWQAYGRTGLWERRRAQLPLWRWVAEVWNLQVKGRRLVALVQPAYSQALHCRRGWKWCECPCLYVPLCPRRRV